MKSEVVICWCRRSRAGSLMQIPAPVCGALLPSDVSPILNTFRHAELGKRYWRCPQCSTTLSSSTGILSLFFFTSGTGQPLESLSHQQSAYCLFCHRFSMSFFLCCSPPTRLFLREVARDVSEVRWCKYFHPSLPVHPREKSQSPEIAL